MRPCTNAVLWFTSAQFRLSEPQRPGIPGESPVSMKAPLSKCYCSAVCQGASMAGWGPGQHGAKGSPWGLRGLAGRPVPQPQPGVGKLGAPGQHQHLSPSCGHGQTEARPWAFGWVCLGGGGYGLAWQTCPAAALLEQGQTASALTWGPGPGWGIYS